VQELKYISSQILSMRKHHLSTLYSDDEHKATAARSLRVGDTSHKLEFLEELDMFSNSRAQLFA
jgi:hypothetical protein